MSGAAAHAVVVLAAGASVRLGQPKQLLRREAETLLHRAVRLGWETGPHTVVVVLGHERAAMQAALAGMAYQPVFNDASASGIGSSLRAAAVHVQQHRRVLLLGCDQPALSLAHLQALLQGARGAAAESAASLLHGAAGVPAVVPGHWFSALPEVGDRGFRDRLRALPPSDLFLLADAALEQDIDTPEDLAAARARGQIDA